MWHLLAHMHSLHHELPAPAPAPAPVASPPCTGAPAPASIAAPAAATASASLRALAAAAAATRPRSRTLTVAATSAAFVGSCMAFLEPSNVSRNAPMEPKYDSWRKNRGCTSPFAHAFMVNVSVRTAILLFRKKPPVKNTLRVAWSFAFRYAICVMF